MGRRDAGTSAAAIFLLLLWRVIPLVSGSHGAFTLSHARTRYFMTPERLLRDSSPGRSLHPPLQRYRHRPQHYSEFGHGSWLMRPAAGRHGGESAPRRRLAYGSGEFLDLSSWTSRILLLNVGMFFLQRMIPEITFMGAKNDVLIRRGQFHRLFTPMLLHVNLQHLMANSFSLHNLGHEVESLFGTRAFLTLYLLSGLSGNVMSFAAGTAPVALGASTAVAGLLGGLGFFCWQHRNIWNMQREMRAIAEAIMINALYGMSSARIDNFGHLGGLLGGVACGFLFGPRLTPEVTSLGRVTIVNRPRLQTAVRKAKAALRQRGLLPPLKAKMPPPPPQRKRRNPFSGFLGSVGDFLDRSKGQQQRSSYGQGWGSQPAPQQREQPWGGLFRRRQLGMVHLGSRH